MGLYLGVSHIEVDADVLFTFNFSLSPFPLPLCDSVTVLDAVQRGQQDSRLHQSHRSGEDGRRSVLSVSNIYVMGAL